MTAGELARGVREKRWQSESVVQSCLGRIDDRERDVHAWAQLSPRALHEARQRDRIESEGGLLHGVPVAVKDLFDTHDLPTAYGSAFYEGHRPSTDAAAVAHLRGAGAIVLGKTQTVEFGATRPCATRNPRNPEHTPGGSSSGSAAAVADGHVPLALGTQTGGSIIRPASFCGVVGFKPSYGSISPAGVKSYAWSLDTVGAFARCVDDVALLFAVLRAAPAPMLTAPVGFRIALFKGPFAAAADATAAERLDEVAAACSSAGAVVEEVGTPALFEESIDLHRTLSRYEMGRSLWPERSSRESHRLGTPLIEEIDRGRSTSDAAYTAAKRRAIDVEREARKSFAGFDVVLTFATPGEAPRGLHSTGDATFNLSWSLLGWPCISLPGGHGPTGLPLGIQLIAFRYEDDRLLAASAWIERVLSNLFTMEKRSAAP